MKKINYDQYINTKINRLTIKSYYKKDWLVRFICKCDCGTEKDMLAYNVLGNNAKSCGCLRVEACRESARQMGLNSRKYEKKCNHCGIEEHYAKGYCRNCYTRLHKKGTLEYRELLHKKIIPLTTEQSDKAINIMDKYASILTKADIIGWDSFSRYRRGRKPSYKTIKKCFNYLGLDIFKELKIDDKYKNPKKYIA